MKILITSDTHGRLDRIEQVRQKHRDIDYHIDAGDLGINPHHLERFHIITVKGNNDFFSTAPYERVLDFTTLKIYLTHGHKEHVKFGYGRLIQKAEAVGADLVVFGHTHQTFYKQENKMIIINPGAIGDYQGSYALYENGQITFHKL